MQGVYYITLADAWALYDVSPDIGENQTHGHKVIAVFADPEPLSFPILGTALLSMAGFVSYRRRKQSAAYLAA